LQNYYFHGYCWTGIVAAILKMVTGRNFQCQESIQDIIIYPHMKCHWNRTMLNLCSIVVAILKMVTDRNFSKISTGHHFQNGRHNAAQIPHCLISTSWIDSRHRKISTGLHFQNGRHNTAKIQHCSISKVAFDLFFKLVISGEIK
jgi:hypothetical protein